MAMPRHIGGEHSDLAIGDLARRAKTSNAAQRFPHANAQRPKCALAKYMLANLRPTHTAKVLVSAWLLRFCSGRAPWTKRAWETI